MVGEQDVGVVESACPGCGHRWRRSYGLVHCEYLYGEVRDYVSLAGVRVASPFNPEGAPARPKWARKALGGPVPGLPVPRRDEDVRHRSRPLP